MNFQMSFETFHATEILKCMLGILVEKQALRRTEVLAHTRPCILLGVTGISLCSLWKNKRAVELNLG